jgi:hypothetical protein
LCTEGYSIVFKHFWGKLFPGILHVTSTNLIRSNLLSESISSSKFRMCEFHLCRLAHMLLQKWSNCKGLAHLWDFDLKVYKRLKVVFELIRKCFYSPSWKKKEKKSAFILTLLLWSVASLDFKISTLELLFWTEICKFINDVVLLFTDLSFFFFAAG